MTVLASSALGAGFIGFLVVLALVLAAVLLFRSMTKHLRRVPKSFDPPDEAGSPPEETAP
jgi:O-antigen ligase